jgi:putative endonuclease
MAGAKTSNRETGDLGEDAATRVLLDGGYWLIEPNYRCPAGEIDIIAEGHGTVAFVEVKTRSPRAYLSPASAVDEEKHRHIRAASKYYLRAFREPSPVRFDIVSVLLDDTGAVASGEVTKAAFE